MILEKTKQKVVTRLKKEGLLSKKILLKAKVLSAQEAIGNPEEYDFPLLKGKEKIVEANYEGYRGHAFTDMYGGFEGTLEEVFGMPSSNNYRRALQVAAINALTNYWGMGDDTVHCKDDRPKQCAREYLRYFDAHYPNVERIAFIGYQPALIDTFLMKYKLKILDLDQENIGQEKFGQVILDGSKDMREAINWAEVVVATGSSVINGTIDELLETSSGKDIIFYGVSIAGTARLLGLKRMCFVADDEQ